MGLAVCILGGCHLEGYGVGIERGFASLLRKRLINEFGKTEVRTFPFFRLRDAAKASTILADHAPDVLILQLGNYEGAPALFRRGKSTGSSAGAPACWAHDDQFRPGLGRTLKNASKRVLHAAFGGRRADYSQWDTQAHAFFEAVALHAVPKVIVLTPFPSVDAIHARYRRRLGEIVSAKARSHGFLLEDSFVLLESTDLFLPDGEHLNSGGHRLLAARLSADIRDMASTSRDRRDDSRAARSSSGGQGRRRRTAVAA